MQSLVNCENIVIIPSLINCKTGIYTREQRFEQTKKTIASVREKIPDIFLVFIDVTIFNIDEKKYFTNNCDLFINPYDNVELTNKVNNRKSYGEKSYLTFALNTLDNNSNNYLFSNFPNLKYFFKVGGRYFLNDNFNYDKYNNNFDNVNILPIPNLYTACQTCLFKITKNNIIDFINNMNLCDSDLKNGLYDMERMFYKYIINSSPDKYKHIDILGMTCLTSDVNQIINV